jgi:hypothetical protein
MMFTHTTVLGSPIGEHTYETNIVVLKERYNAVVQLKLGFVRQASLLAIPELAAGVLCFSARCFIPLRHFLIITMSPKS